jgi:hypothetical protein
MKFIARIVLIIIAGFFLSNVLPWWILVVLSFIIGVLIYGNGFSVFISGFLGGGILWLSYAWYIDFKSQSIMSEKVAELFPVNDKFYLIIATGLIGAIIAGFGAITGNSLRSLFIKKKSGNYYN